MGPITLFDKSFLQSLSVDESLWFDHFFLTNVCPLFYVETLADLSKTVREGRTPEQEVELIADKSPEMSGNPSAHHTDLCVSNLLGYPVPMTGQIPLAGGRLVKTDGKSGAVFERSPEAEAFSRWQRREFLEIERQFAKAWREALPALDLGEASRRLRELGIDPKSCKDLEAAKTLAMMVASDADKPHLSMTLALRLLNIPPRLHGEIVRNWGLHNFPPLADYAPYATHVLSVEIFFQIALAANLISSERPSNRVDVSYLFYLPFSMMFVSSDRLHRRCAPLFLRSDQDFVWGPDLKSNLGQLNSYYLQLPDSTKEQGVLSFAGEPPELGNRLVAKLWDQFLLKYGKEGQARVTDGSPESPPTPEEINRMADAPSLLPDDVDFDPLEPGRVVIERRVSRRKGAWYQVRKSLSGG